MIPNNKLITLSNNLELIISFLNDQKVSFVSCKIIISQNFEI